MICKNNAPHVFIPPKGKRPGLLYQAACNDWTCPRCGLFRAKYEYGRIAQGAKDLSRTQKLYFLTITCKDEPLHEAERQYSVRVNRLLATLRAHVKKARGFWSYAQVTERQPGRKHPHSHFLATFAPTDAFYVADDYDRYVMSVRLVNGQIPYEMRYTPDPVSEFDDTSMFSVWFQLACVKVGLGVQARLSLADSPVATGKYIAKYLFKQTIRDTWPRGWRRVRYAQSWPKLPDNPSEHALVIFTAYDWTKVANSVGEVVCVDPQVYEVALLRKCYNVICTTPNHIDLEPLTSDSPKTKKGKR